VWIMKGQRCLLLVKAFVLVFVGGILASCSDNETSSGTEANSLYAGQYDATNTANVHVIGWGQKATATAFAAGYTTPDKMDLSGIGSPRVYVEAHPTKPDYVRMGAMFKMSYRIIVNDDGTVTGSATGFTSNGKCTTRGTAKIVNKVASWTGTTSCTADLTGTCTVTGTQTIDFSPTDPVITGVTEYSCPVGGFKSSYNAVLSKTSTETATMNHLKSADGVALSGLPVF
jgi:hypothetical protein